MEAEADTIHASSSIRFANYDGNIQREGHLAVLLPLSRVKDGIRIVDEIRIYTELSAFLAFKHISERSGEVLPELPDRLSQCDFQWTYRHHDTQFSPLQAVTDLLSYYDKDNETEVTIDDHRLETTLNMSQPAVTQQKPFAIMGAARSEVSYLVSILGAALEIPQISSSTSADILDQSPFFARTNNSHKGAIRTLMAYLHNLGVTHAAVFFVNDAWGQSFRDSIAYFAKVYGDIKVYHIAYALEDDLDVVMHHVKEQYQDFNYFLGAISSSAWKPVVQKAYEHKVMGPASGHQWFFYGLHSVLNEGSVFDLEEEMDLVLALHGTAMVAYNPDPHPSFDQALADFANNTALQEEFLKIHSEPHFLENITFSSTPGRAATQYLTYDAVIALGITACETPGLFMGKDFYDNLVQVDFNGTSGRVQFNPETGTRLESKNIDIINLVLASDVTDALQRKEGISLKLISTATVDYAPDMQQGRVQILHPFVYYDNTTQAPLSLTPVDMDMNLIPMGAMAFGYTLAALVMLLSIGWALWVHQNRTKLVIAAAQPFFLYQMCMGTFLIALTIVPLSFQEDMPGLDQACKVTPWFLCVGFCVAISALYSKAQRINQLLSTGSACRRIRIKPTDVMKTFLVIITINIGLLLGWTFSPYSLSWHRDEVSQYDDYRRSIASIGMCRPDGGNEHLFFTIPLIFVNILVLVLATYQSFKARNLPSLFSETKYLAFSMLSLSETTLLGFLSIGAALTNPTTYHIVVSLMICIGCLSILLPLFVPKYWECNTGTGVTNSVNAALEALRRGEVAATIRP